MKLKFIVLLMLGMTAANAQTAKKKTGPAKAKTTVTKSAATSSAADGIFAEIETAKGKITIQLEYKKTPITVANFISLAEGTNSAVAAQYKGKPFFNGLK